MNVFLIFTLTVIEIGLVALTISEFKKKKEWYRNRFFANAIEVLTFAIFAFFPGIDYGFRFKALIVILVVRLILSIIFFLPKRNREETIKKSKIIVSALLAVIMFVSGSVMSFIFVDYKGKKPSGQYEVETAEAVLIDQSRSETFENDGSYREVPMNIYYPKTENGEKFPLVIFSHGAFGYYKSNYSTYMELASNGYVVISLSHPYHSFFCKDTSGKTITVDPTFLNNSLYVNELTTTEDEIFELSSEWMKLRTADVNFVLDTLENYAGIKEFDESWYLKENTEKVVYALETIDFDKIGIMGHSLGGATAVAIGRCRDDVDAVVDIDGTMLTEQIELVECEPVEFEGRVYDKKYILNEEPYPIPILNIDNDEHHKSRIEAEKIGFPYANNAVMENALYGYDTYFKNAGHMNLTDLPLFSPYLAKALGTGTIDSSECVNEMNEIILSFFNAKLKESQYGDKLIIEECYGD